MHTCTSSTVTVQERVEMSIVTVVGKSFVSEILLVLR